MKSLFAVILFVGLAAGVFTLFISQAHGKTLARKQDEMVGKSRVFIESESAAKDFLGGRSRRAQISRGLNEECCSETCAKEEISEVIKDETTCEDYYADYKSKVNKASSKLCEKAGTYEHKLYQVFGNYKDFNDAKATCEANGMILAKDLSEETHSAILQELRNAGIGGTDVWINGQQDSSNAWVTTDGEPLNRYHPWQSGEPNGSGRCLQLWAGVGHKWDDTPCSDRKPFVCQETADDDGDEQGDPHFTTFDGRHYSYQGASSYILFTDGCENSASTFSVESSTEPAVERGKNVSRVSSATIRLNIGRQNPMLIELHRAGLTLINGKDMTSFPYRTLDGVSIERLGTDDQTIVEVADLFTIMWDGVTHIKVELDDNLSGKVCGMLGNADRNPLNDFRMPDGLLTRDVEEFAKSWKTLESKR